MKRVDKAFASLIILRLISTKDHETDFLKIPVRNLKVSLNKFVRVNLTFLSQKSD